MLLKVLIRPGGDVEVRTESDDVTMAEGAAAIRRFLQLLAEKGRIPFSRVMPIESHRGHGLPEAESNAERHRQHESE